MHGKKEKILIIKAGYTEFLDKSSNSRVVSFGDVLRTTVLLNLFKEDEVTWVTDKEAFPLLENNPYIYRLLPLDWITAEQLKLEEFDRIINLEKVPGICALTERIKNRRSRYGFTFNSQTGDAEAYDLAYEVLAVSSDSAYKKENRKTTQELLFEMIGEKWNGEEYVLGYKPKTKEIYDVGFNTKVGIKWPTKAWPTEKWNALKQLLEKDGIYVSNQEEQGQEILNNLYAYTDWINSCKLIITNDSLGMHLAIALKKKVIGLFGVTPHNEVYFYGKGEAVLPEPLPECYPCLKTICQKQKICMEDISVDRVYSLTKKYICATTNL